MAGRTHSAPSTTSLLRRYLQMYWLKPFDAVNDTANAWALRQFSWEEPILEVGGGDGVFSFIMHDGAFRFADDRFDQADPTRRGDLFDVVPNGCSPMIRREATCSYAAGVDLKRSHVFHGRATHLYRGLAIAAPAPLPFASGSFKTVFLYFPHGVLERGAPIDYEGTLREIRRVLRPDGALLMTAMHARIARCFVCHPLSRWFGRLGWRRIADYFRRLDAGRYDEITSFSRTPEEWAALLQRCGFEPAEAWTHLRPVAWRVYDLQTRPVLRPLIRWSQFLRRAHLKKVVKMAWIALWLPVLVVFYRLFARPTRYAWGSTRAGLVFAFRAVPMFRECP